MNEFKMDMGVVPFTGPLEIPMGLREGPECSPCVYFGIIRVN